MDAQARCFRTGERIGQDPFGAPFHVSKKGRFQGPHTQQGVPSVKRWANDQIVIVQGGESFCQVIRRDTRTVTANDDGTVLPFGEYFTEALFPAPAPGSSLLAGGTSSGPSRCQQ